MTFGIQFYLDSKPIHSQFLRSTDSSFFHKHLIRQEEESNVSRLLNVTLDRAARKPNHARHHRRSIIKRHLSIVVIFWTETTMCVCECARLSRKVHRIWKCISPTWSCLLRKEGWAFPCPHLRWSARAYFFIPLPVALKPAHGYEEYSLTALPLTITES